MTSKERVNTAYNHHEPDRVPIGEMHIMPHVSSEILGREAITGEGKMYFQRAVLLADGRRDEFVERYSLDSLELVRKLGLDLIMTEIDPGADMAYRISDLTDSGWTETDLDTGIWRVYKFEKSIQAVMEIDSTEKQGGTEGILRHIEAVEARSRNMDPSCFDSTRAVCRDGGDELFCMAKIPDLIPSGRSWYTAFMELPYTEPELLERLLRSYTDFGLAAAREYIECGVDGVMIASDWAINTGPLFPPAFIEEFLVPQVNEIADFCHEHGIVVMKHTDGIIMRIADAFFGMHIDAYQGIEPYAGMDIAEIKQKYGHKITLMGNVDCGRTLPFGSREQIIDETRACIRDAGPGGGYILSSSNTISYPIPESALLTMIEAAHTYGSYPIDVTA